MIYQYYYNFTHRPAEGSPVAPMPSSSPLPAAGTAERNRASATELLLENGNSEEDDSNSHDGAGNDDVVVEKIEVNGKEQAPPKKKTRRGKRKPKSAKPSPDQVSVFDMFIEMLFSHCIGQMSFERIRKTETSTKF